ncbi:nuclear transport factor 2 family protein [Xanthomonas sp.]|uniref:nuclear transport factor 2 family protein n=1 Tax=Xanthomonas sp. TaxID=29446 RepID=UPI001F13B56A|nr:nuclear transport factor 2 family protein [Xanthomonas sp.]
MSKRPGAMRWLVWLALCLAVAGCRRDPPEQRLRARIAELQQALEDRRIGAAMEVIAEDFSSGPGMDRAALHNLLRAQFLRNAKVGTTLGPLAVAMRQDSATVDFDAMLSGGDGGLLPDRLQRYRVSTGWRERDGQWQLYYAQWEAQ